MFKFKKSLKIRTSITLMFDHLIFPYGLRIENEISNEINKPVFGSCDLWST